MDPVLKKLLNSLICPICKAPIDMIGYGIRSHRGYNYGCAANLDHYVISIVLNDLGFPNLAVETVHVYDASHKYQLTKRYNQNPTSVRTEIIVLKTDAEGRVQFSFKNEPLIMDKELFDFSKFNVDKAVNRIKTIFVFS